MNSDDVRKNEAAQATESDQKQPWVKPVIKASASFDKQAMACAMNDTSFLCQAAVSGG